MSNSFELSSTFFQGGEKVSDGGFISPSYRPADSYISQKEPESIGTLQYSTKFASHKKNTRFLIIKIKYLGN